MPQYAIRFVDDDALPDGHDFVFVVLADGGGLILYRRSALSPQSLEDSWTAYRALANPPPIAPPHLRSVV